MARKYINELAPRRCIDNNLQITMEGFIRE